MAASSEHVWVGAETGILKGLNFVKRTTTNFTDFKTLDKQQEVHAMCWGPGGKDQILLGLRNGIVKQFDVNKHGFTVTKDYGELGGQYVGMATMGDSIITCLSNGHLTVWQDDEAKMELDLGKNLKKMKQHKEKSNIIATGGKENDLQVYDLEKPDKPIFQAKNVRHNFLDLRVPVWINDMQFLSGDSSKIVTCTAYHQVRLYDLKTPQRRPVLDVEFQDCPIMALDVTPDQRSVVVGNAQGQMGRIDFRNGIYAKAYKGFAGSIRSVQCHPTLQLVGSCGLDRFFRLHHLRTGKMEKKIYLKSRLTAFLFTDRDHTQDILPAEDAVEEAKEEDAVTEGGDSGDDLWDGMEEESDLTEETSKRKNNSELGLRGTKRRVGSIKTLDKQADILPLRRDEQADEL